MRIIRGLLALVLLAAVVIGLLLHRDRIRSFVARETPILEERAAREPATEELADRAQTKLEQLRPGGDARVALSAAEIESLLQFRHAGLLPAFVDSPRVAMRDGRFELAARLPVDRLPARDVLGPAADLLPDTVPVTLTGRLFPYDRPRSAMVVVEGIDVAGIPLPRRVVAPVLERLGREDAEGLPADALPVPLPPGARAAYVRGDSLVLVAGAGDGNGEP